MDKTAALMKAITRSRYGSPDVLQLTTPERPVPKRNVVLVRIKAAGRDYGQWHLMAGQRPLGVLRKALAPWGTLVLGGGEGGDRFFGAWGARCARRCGRWC